MALSDALRGSGDAERAATAAAKAVSVANAGSAGAALVEEIRNRGCEGDVQGFGAAMGEAMAAAVACWEGMGRCRALMGEGKHAEAARVLRGSLAACGKVAER